MQSSLYTQPVTASKKQLSKDKKKGKVKLFSGHNGSLLRQQPREAAEHTISKVTTAFPYA